jgi:hypothetical protein
MIALWMKISLQGLWKMKPRPSNCGNKDGADMIIYFYSGTNVLLMVQKCLQ